MFRTIALSLRKFDWVLFGSALLLTALGLVVLYTTSLGSGGADSAFSAGDFSNFWKQLGFAAIGICIAIVVAAFDYRMLAGLSKPLYFGGVALLLLVLFFGRTVRGTTGWFGIGGFGIQPSELVKLILIVFLAKFFADYARAATGISFIARSGLAFALIFVLVLFQPDFGSAMLLLAVWGTMLLISGIRLNHILVIGAVFVMTAALAWVFVLKPYQKDRFMDVWDPSRDPQGRGYNVTQSIIAIGSGGIFGKGLGFGSQSRLRFLPERQTDFIFATAGEELGFVGVLFICGLFGIVFFRGYLLAKSSRDEFTTYLIIGILASIAIEAFVNIGGNLRFLPLTGVTLPFMSYGGSSLVVKFAMIGVLESIAVRR